MRGKPHDAPAKIDVGTIRAHLLGRKHDMADILRPKDLDQAFPIEVAPRLQGGAQSHVSDDVRSILVKGCRAETMIWMHMRYHDMADRSVGPFADFSAQPSAIGKAASRIGHEHRLRTDDEADIRDAVVIGGAGFRMQASADENAGRDLLKPGLFSRKPGLWRTAKAEAAEQQIAP